MKTIFLLVILALNLMRSAGAGVKTPMEVLYGDELDEFHTNAPPDYTTEELKDYVTNSIKFILNAAPDIVKLPPSQTVLPWKTFIHMGSSKHGDSSLRLIVPLLDHNMQPLFVTGANGHVVPNFDVVQLSVGSIPFRGSTYRFLRPEAILRPTRKKPSYQTWTYSILTSIPKEEQRRISHDIPWQGDRRERALMMTVFDQIAHPDFRNTGLNGLHYIDVYSPGYTGRGPRGRLLGHESHNRLKLRFDRDWDHFFARLKSSSAQQASNSRLVIDFSAPQPRHDVEKTETMSERLQQSSAVPKARVNELDMLSRLSGESTRTPRWIDASRQGGESEFRSKRSKHQSDIDLDLHL